MISERSKDPEQKSFQRSLNRLLDPSQLEDMERKRKANLLHQVSFQYVLFFNCSISYIQLKVYWRPMTKFFQIKFSTRLPCLRLS